MDTHTQDARSGDLLRILRRRWGIIAITVALTTVVALAWSLNQPKIYEAEVTMLVKPSSEVNAVAGLASGSFPDPERVAATDLALAEQPVLADRVIKTLNLDRGRDDLSGSVSAKANGNSNVLSITVRDEDPRAAARIANAYAVEYATFRAADDRERLASALRTIRDRLEAENTSRDARERLRQQRDQILLLQNLLDGGVRVLQPATVPSDPVSPKPLRNAVLAALIGLLLGAGIALVRGRSDPRLPDEQSVRDVLRGIPVLASVPDFGSGAENRRLQAEGFRGLRTTLAAIEVDGVQTTTLVTSATMNEGKTATSLNLALAMAERGERVLLIDADLRRSGLSVRLGLQDSEGTAEVLAGDDLEDHIVEVVVDQPALASSNGDAAAALAGIVTVLPAGHYAANSHALMDAARLQRLLLSAKDQADRVVIDGTPLGLINDALPLARLVDGVIVVSRLSRARRDETERLAQQLSQAGVEPTGLVVFGAHATQSYRAYVAT